MGEATDRRGLFRSMLAGVARVSAESSSVLDSLQSLTAPGEAEDSPVRTPPSRSPASQRTAEIDEVLAEASRFGLESRAGAMHRTVRHSICISPGPVPVPGRGDAIIGGEPRLQADCVWPEWRGRRLSFVAAVDLGESPDSTLRFPGPVQLLFFYDTGSRASGFEAGHLGAGAVLARPEGAGGGWVAEGRTAGLSVEAVIPRVWSNSVEALLLSEPERVGWEQARRQLAENQGTRLTDDLPSDHIVHRVFGYPDNTGGDMPLICELGTNGYDTPEYPFSHPEAPALNERAARWELLAEFSADEAFDWSWGPSAERLYFWIDRDALAAGDLSQIWTIVR